MNTQKLKQNAVWLVIGGLLVLAGVFFGLFVWPAWGNLERLEHRLASMNSQLRMINSPDQPIPGLQDINSWSNRQARLREVNKLLTQFYMTEDEPLKRWMDGTTGQIDFSKFKNQYELETHKMDEALPKSAEEDPKGVKEETLGYGWETLDVAEMEATPDAEKQEIMREVMKRYWVRKKFENAVKDAKSFHGSGKLLQFKWLKNVYDPAKFPKSAQGYQTIPTGPNSPYPCMEGNPVEYVAPGELGRTRTFGIAVQLSNTDVPLVIAKMLSPNVEPKLLLEIAGINIVSAGKNELKHEVFVPKHEPEKWNEILGKEYEKLKPQPVKLYITGRLIDIDTVGIKKRLEAPPPAGQ